MSSSFAYETVSGIRETAPAESSTPQSDRVWKVRLSRATTEVGGVVISCVPVLSSMVTVPDPAVVASGSASPPDAQPERASRPTRATLVAVRVLGTDMERLLFCGDVCTLVGRRSDGRASRPRRFLG